MSVRVSGATPDLAVLVARRLALLAEPRRLRLLDELHQRKETTVRELAGTLGATHANVSKHLNLLLGERMVACRRDGADATYRIADPSLKATGRRAVHRRLPEPAHA